MENTKAYSLLVNRKSKFLSQLNEAIKYATDMLPLINVVFNTYTIHGMKHAVNVAEYMFDLVEDAEKLSDLELIAIIYAALFHDFGMIVSNEEIEEIKTDQLLLGNKKYSKVLEKYGDEKIALQECVRPMHGKRSCEFLDKISGNIESIFGIPDTSGISFKKEIGLICQAHNEDFDWIISCLRNDIKKGRYSLNAQYIAVLLRIGDYLDIDEQRAPLYLYKYLQPKDYSDLEWSQHFCIENYEKIFVNSKTGLKEIIFQGESKDPAVHRKLLKYFDGLNAELRNATSLCEKFENDIYLMNVKTHVVNKVYSSGFTFSDFRLELDYNAVTNLLMGEHIYGDKRYGLREIIQNSIDACKTMQETAENHPDFRMRKYEPFISIVVDKDRNIVTILDNGSGMTTNILKKYFLNVGVSYYKSDDYVLQGRKYLPIGHYGIGFLACFMLSDKVEVKTRHIDENAIIKIEFEKNSEYICLTYEEKWKTQGTEITLDYEQFIGVFNNDDKAIKSFIENNFLDCDIPIKISFQENGQIETDECNVAKIEKVLTEQICLNEYLDGIEAYVDCTYKQINFVTKLEQLNKQESYYFDEEKGNLISEAENVQDIKDFVKEDKIRLVSVPVVYSDQEADFIKAYDVLEDYEEALDKIYFQMVNIMTKDVDSRYNENIIENLDDEIIEGYTLDKLCKRFYHSYNVPAYTQVETFDVIINKNCEPILPYDREIQLGQYSFSPQGRVYIKNVLLSRARVKIPYLLDGIAIKNAVINIANSKFVPNVSRNDMNNEMLECMGYAVGKALHLWLLDNMDFTPEQKTLVEDFIAKCYPDDCVGLRIND